jgi:hypothetical protein
MSTNTHESVFYVMHALLLKQAAAYSQTMRTSERVYFFPEEQKTCRELHINHDTKTLLTLDPNADSTVTTL